MVAIFTGGHIGRLRREAGGAHPNANVCGEREYLRDTMIYAGKGRNSRLKDFLQPSRDLNQRGRYAFH
ncbi:hypothetical protein KIN20_014293 [Parelaphostrongylus tenuis]|uniref:Uncharacterized protein n=1 Tax=Parelaphostrongylus tenuis TaxID=148309 RepID=A0AAD5QLK2_PARTN|nr:hypothetical protein KIN20_014293 [Parelaphostrongylus tenuis]